MRCGVGVLVVTSSLVIGLCFEVVLFSFWGVEIFWLPQDSLWMALCLGFCLFSDARFLWWILFSPHRQHGAMQILVHVDVALHRKFYFLHIEVWHFSPKICSTNRCTSDSTLTVLT
jgi:hypothetical protein